MKLNKYIDHTLLKPESTVSQIEKLCEEVETAFKNDLAGEVKSSDIGEFVMAKLKLIDEVAYIRFASVYRKFADVEYFKKFLNNL